MNDEIIICDTSNTKISKKIRLKTTKCRSDQEIGRFNFYLNHHNSNEVPVKNLLYNELQFSPFSSFTFFSFNTFHCDSFCKVWYNINCLKNKTKHTKRNIKMNLCDVSLTIFVHNDTSNKFEFRIVTTNHQIIMPKQEKDMLNFHWQLVQWTKTLYVVG